MKPTPILASFVALSLLPLGCGGDSIGGSSKPSISLSVTGSNLTYGQPTTISWTTHNVASIDSASFPISSSDLNGSITDKPATSTTYKITAHGTDGSTVSSLVTVSVQKGAKKILFLADTAISGINQVTDYLQTLSTQTVQVSQTLPNSFSADVIVVSTTANVSPANVPAIQSFLNAGGGVVLIRYSTRKLATGDLSNSNISAIGSFFAGVTDSSDYTWPRQIVSSSPVGFALSASAFGDDTSAQGVSPVSSQAILLTTDYDGTYAGFAYSPSTGGKVAYSGDAPIDSIPESVALRTMFLSEVRWASGE